MLLRVEVKDKEGIFDAVGESVKKGIIDLGLNCVADVRFVQIYNLLGNPSKKDLTRICNELLIDRISQEFRIVSDKKAGFFEDAKATIVEVACNPGVMDPVQDSALKAIRDLGIKSIQQLHTAKKYALRGKISKAELNKICEKLLYNKTIEHIVYPPSQETTGFARGCSPQRGEVSPLAEMRKECFGEMSLDARGRLSADEPRRSQRRKPAASPIGEHFDEGGSIEVPRALSVEFHKKERGIIPKQIAYNFKLIKVDILNADDKKLIRISKNGQLFLNLTEMQAIKDYFKSLGRNPTDCELETLAQTWSEHCGHKTFRGIIEYQEQKLASSIPALPAGRKHQASKPRTRVINNLLKSTIMKATQELNKPWCVSVFQDNSGVIKFDKEHNICFKVETHNHPSALEPFGGANTGIGGVIRDPLGTGLGAKPFLNTDVFCFGPLDYPFSKLPKGLLHPKRIMKGVVSGVRDYGNKMGIPTVNGAVLFDESFVGNPLVYCGTAGIMPKDKSFKKVSKGDFVVLVGGKTGRDGIHGATFSSGELTHESEQISGGAVQIGNPITEKKMSEAILKARDENLYQAITDCGGGGLSSAVGEMGKDLGCRVDLEKVPLKYQGLTYTEIWISEAQERMILSVPKNKINRLKEVFKSEDVEVTVIGEFSDTKRLELFYNKKLVCDLDMEFLHDGTPKIKRKAIWIQKKHVEPKFSQPKDLGAILKKILAHPNVCSKEWIIRQYDHEVQGGSVLKPLGGVLNDGPNDAAIVRPLLNSGKGVVVSCGINFKYGLIDPYWMAASCIDEAIRQIVSVGGSLKQIALLDNFCWGNPDKPDRLAGVVRAANACYDFSKYFGTPFISGKDSLNNEYAIAGRSIPIAGTLLVSAISVIQDVKKTVSSDLKEEGNLIYCVGQTFDELGASCYYDVLGYLGANVPKVHKDISKKIMLALSCATQKGLVRSAHDCSEGGIAVAVAEMAFSGGLGADVFLGEIPYEYPVSSIKHQGRDNIILFSESNSRFIVEVKKENQKEFKRIFKGLPFGLIGCVSAHERLKIYGLDSKIVVDEDIWELKEAWQRTLRL